MIPPWHLDKTVGIQKFKNDVSLSDHQIDTIVGWVDAGAPQGNPKDLPAPKQWPSDDVWHLADQYGRTPDLILKAEPWTQKAQGQDQWWQPVVDTGLTEDRVRGRGGARVAEGHDPQDHRLARQHRRQPGQPGSHAVGRLGTAASTTCITRT